MICQRNRGTSRKVDHEQSIRGIVKTSDGGLYYKIAINS